MDIISQKGFYETLSKQTTKLLDGLKERAEKTNIALTTNQAGAMFGFFFTEEKEVTTFEQVCACDAERFKKFYHGMLKQGIYLAPSDYETGFVSSMHSDDDIEKTLDAAEKVFLTL